ncbi:MAG: 4-(cytidine 5'-diphospho)-2-C-methyl-D-erythritol kinase [Stellaceae bacterium]
MIPIAVFAPAKINLYLHVIGRRPDGYHLLDSLVAFADIGDRLAAEPAEALSLEVTGPEAAHITVAADDNLVLRAARLLAGRAGVTGGASLHLEKNLPISAGIAGGSSDAAAALLALRRLWEAAIGDEQLHEIGASLGADIPACLYRRPVWVGGIGERLDPAAALPPAGILLVNPRKVLPTATVFKAWRSPFSHAGRFSSMPGDAVGLAQMLVPRRNDLTKVAIGHVPEIRAVLRQLGALPGVLLARMSGSGATCFALFADRASAERARATVAAAEPRWWCAAGAFIAEQGHSG